MESNQNRGKDTVGAGRKWKKKGGTTKWVFVTTTREGYLVNLV